MNIVSFTHAHIEDAARLAAQNYEEERRYHPALPSLQEAPLPKLSIFAENKLGAAAYDGSSMLGFLCCLPPFRNPAGGELLCAFSPIHAHAALSHDRARIYAALYSAVAEKWVSAAIYRHAISLYAHDTAAQTLFQWHGFGLRCADAIRPMTAIDAAVRNDLVCRELHGAEIAQTLALDNILTEHLASSPTFMQYLCPSTAEDIVRESKQKDRRYFAAFLHHRMLAYFRIQSDGETFVCGAPSMRSISGACCLPKFRGKGVASALLQAVISILSAEGYTALGVDFETMNPAASGFWLRYFSPYTLSPVRWIDHRA